MNRSIFYASLPVVGMVTTAVVMTGCQTAADPHEGGFISGIWNLTTGGYESRVVAKQTDVATQQATQEQLRQQEVALNQEHAQLKRELNEAEQRLAALDEDIQGYRSRLQQERRLRDSDRARLRQAEASVSQIRALLTQAKQANQDKGTGSDVHDQTKAIQARLSNLQDLVYTLASH